MLILSFLPQGKYFVIVTLLKIISFLKNSFTGILNCYDSYYSLCLIPNHSSEPRQIHLLLPLK